MIARTLPANMSQVELEFVVYWKLRWKNKPIAKAYGFAMAAIYPAIQRAKAGPTASTWVKEVEVLKCKRKG